MITIKVIGLDQFLVGSLSKDLSQNVANIYELDLDDVNFVAPNCMIFHNGFEQTSWHVIVDVMAPKKVQVLQEQVSLYLIKALKEVAINVEIIFHYYSEDDRVISINDEYPRYVTESNSVSVEEEFDDGESENDDEEIYSGNIFEDFEKIISKK